MRVSPIAIAISLSLATVSSAVHSQRADDDVNPQSVALVEQGRSALADGNNERAADLVETALVVDPRNRDGYIALAEIALARDLPGKAIRFYREALTIDPNDLAALSGQGRVYVQRGAVARAQRNLTRIEALCETACSPGTVLASAIEAGPPPQQLAANQATETTDQVDEPVNP
jgi:Tfp pilus assembly protein PilF